MFGRDSLEINFIIVLSRSTSWTSPTVPLGSMVLSYSLLLPPFLIESLMLFHGLGNEPNELSGSVSDGTSTINADILPFVDRQRPDLSKATTVAGMNKKTALACWKVLHTKDKFGPGACLHGRMMP
jgi:hypothetical protein